MAGRGRVLLLALVVTLIPVALVLAPGAGSDRSTLDRGPEGTAALAGVLRGLGHEVESLRVGLATLTRRPAGGVLIMPSAPGLIPGAVLGDGEAAILRRWIEAGSTAAVVTHHPMEFLTELGLGYDWEALDRPPRGGQRWRRSLPSLPHPLTLGPPLAVSGRGGLDPGPDWSVLYSLDRVPVVASQSVGDGTLVVIADPYTLTNAGLGKAGNLEFWVRFVGHFLREDGVVMFDDLHAGASDGKGFVAYGRRAGILPAMLLVLFALALYGWRAGTRFGAILPPAAVRNPRASSELVHAVAGLYERADLRGHALAVLSRRFRRALERRSGLKWDRGDLDAWTAAELGPDAARQFARIRRGFAALLGNDRPNREDTLELARLVSRFETTWLAPKRARTTSPDTERDTP